MFTLGLMEGTFIIAALALAFTGGANGRTKIHLILGVPSVVLLGLIAYQANDTSAASGVAEIAGLAVGGLMAFVLPVAGLWYMWRLARPAPVAKQGAEAEQLPIRTEAGTQRRAA